jgi:hypothetical protein
MKFTPSGGAVDIAAGVLQSDPGVLLVKVSDSGCGIGPEMTEVIFEHLYQVANSTQAGRKGLGLGLHIAKELVTRMGGKIWVISELQKGSQFFFTVPVFSLSDLVGPILMHEKKAGEAIAVLAVEINSKDSSNVVPNEILSVARTLLQQCLRPDTDVLLPNQDLMSEHKLFFVVAYTQEHGAEVIGRRILRHLESHEQLQPADFTLTVSHSFLDPISRGANESMKSFVEQVSAGIQDHINYKCLQGSL